jgi:hypothetical protein
MTFGDRAQRRGQVIARSRAVGGFLVIAALTGCAPEMASQPAAGPATVGRMVQVSVDGTVYPLRLVEGEPYMQAHVAPLTFSGTTGPAIRIGGTGGQARLGSHVLMAYCTGATEYLTAENATTVLFGDFGDFLWRDDTMGEFVFPIADCRA